MHARIRPALTWVNAYARPGHDDGAVKALRIIQDEHRSIAAVIHGMQYLVDDIRERGAAPNFEALGAMIYYIDAFPERFHHPKEDAYLFPALRLRHPVAQTLLERLEQEHVAGARKIRALEQALTRYRHGGSGEFAQFAAAVDEYAQFHWQHMRCEETEVLPLAERYLLPSDWRTIDEAFGEQVDPLFGQEPQERYDALFRQIVKLAPPPIGVGPTLEEPARNASRWSFGKP